MVTTPASERGPAFFLTGSEKEEALIERGYNEKAVAPLYERKSESNAS